MKSGIMKKSGQEGFRSGFLKEIDYRWQVSAEGASITKTLIDPETNQAYKYPVPTEMGMAAMCACYKDKKGLDILFSPLNMSNEYYILIYLIFLAIHE